MTTEPELVVLLDEGGRAVGTAPKSGVHHAMTPLHLAFSCYVFDDRGRVLLTRRALGKPTWPGAWTNTCCGHPGPGEPLPQAVRRRLRDELGLEVTDLRLLLPRFRYQARMPDGVVENEMCPVFAATASHVDALAPDRSEVADHEWVDWAEFRADVLGGRREVSPWCVEQVAALPQEPGQATAAPDELLPAAAHA